MTSKRRACFSFTIAFLLAAAPFQSFAQNEDVRPESVRPETDKPSNSVPGVAIDEKPAPIEGVTDETEKPQPKSVVVDQYPPNSKCYVGGRYVAAPPLCPN